MPPVLPPFPPPGALSRNGGALSLNNVFPARLFGKHGRKTLSLNSLLSAEKLENPFSSRPQTAETIKHSAQNCGFGENSWKKSASRRNRDRHFDETAEKRQHGGQKLREKANCKIKRQKTLATKALL